MLTGNSGLVAGIFVLSLSPKRAPPTGSYFAHLFPSLPHLSLSLSLPFKTFTSQSTSLLYCRRRNCSIALHSFNCIYVLLCVCALLLLMASGRNGIQKAPNLRTSSSFKSKLPPTNARRGSSVLPSGADGGYFFITLLLFFFFLPFCFLYFILIYFFTSGYSLT